METRTRSKVMAALLQSHPQIFKDSNPHMATARENIVQRHIEFLTSLGIEVVEDAEPDWTANGVGDAF